MHHQKHVGIQQEWKASRLWNPALRCTHQIYAKHCILGWINPYTAPYIQSMLMASVHICQSWYSIRSIKSVRPPRPYPVEVDGDERISTILVISGFFQTHHFARKSLPVTSRNLQTRLKKHMLKDGCTIISLQRPSLQSSYVSTAASPSCSH